MKHIALCGALAVLLAALLAGCGARAAASARPAGSRELKSTPPDSMYATAAITEQYTLEKVVQAENGGTVGNDSWKCSIKMKKLFSHKEFGKKIFL